MLTCCTPNGYQDALLPCVSLSRKALRVLQNLINAAYVIDPLFQLLVASKPFRNKAIIVLSFYQLLGGEKKFKDSLGYPVKLASIQEKDRFL
jgi:hypothetical protein